MERGQGDGREHMQAEARRGVREKGWGEGGVWSTE